MTARRTTADAPKRTAQRLEALPASCVPPVLRNGPRCGVELLQTLNALGAGPASTAHSPPGHPGLSRNGPVHAPHVGCLPEGEFSAVNVGVTAQRVDGAVRLSVRRVLSISSTSVRTRPGCRHRAAGRGLLPRCPRPGPLPALPSSSRRKGSQASSASSAAASRSSAALRTWAASSDSRSTWRHCARDDSAALSRAAAVSAAAHASRSITYPRPPRDTEQGCVTEGSEPVARMSSASGRMSVPTAKAVHCVASSRSRS